MDESGRAEVAASDQELRALQVPARRERAMPAWLERLREQRSAPAVVDGALIVRRYFPRDLRSAPAILVDAPAEYCAHCATTFADGHSLVHNWKLRQGVRALRTSLTLCDDCDATLRPHAYLRSANSG
jgi:hypothetical protein